MEKAEKEKVETKIKNDITDYIISLGIDKNKITKIEILDTLQGMTNTNYHVKVTYELNEGKINDYKKEEHFFYRLYGAAMSNCLNREVEQTIIKELSDKKLGPKLLCKKPDYCIIEFIENAAEVSLKERYNIFSLDCLRNILVNYSQISNIFKFEIEEGRLKLEKFSNFKGNKNISYSILDEVQRMLPKAKNSFDIFYKKCLEFYKSNDKIPKEIKAKIDLFEDTLKNYEKNFLSLFYNTKGYFVLNHNDMHRWNLIKKDENIYAIDHEYACLCLIGLDAANYMNENSFYFIDSGYERFKEEEIDLNFYFNFYLEYVNSLKKDLKDLIEKEKDFKEYFDILSSKKYYYNLHRLTNVFWFLFCVINLDFTDGKPGDTLQYGADRLKYANMMKELMDKEK